MIKLRLIKEARIRHKAGDIVEVSPAEANFLIASRTAEVIQPAKAATTKKKTEKK